MPSLRDPRNRGQLAPDPLGDSFSVNGSMSAETAMSTTCARFVSSHQCRPTVRQPGRRSRRGAAGRRGMTDVVAPGRPEHARQRRAASGLTTATGSKPTAESSPRRPSRVRPSRRDPAIQAGIEAPERSVNDTAHATREREGAEADRGRAEVAAATAGIRSAQAETRLTLAPPAAAVRRVGGFGEIEKRTQQRSASSGPGTPELGAGSRPAGSGENL